MIRLAAVASRADEYRRLAQQCLEMAGTFRDRKVRIALSQRAEGSPLASLVRPSTTYWWTSLIE